MGIFTHEQFVQRVADVAISRLSSTEQSICRQCKLTYGAGPNGTRGVTYFNRWSGKPDEQAPFVAINALHQESIVQLAGTTIHELGHVLAGSSAGHGKAWKGACEKLGLRRIKAAGTEYKWVMFDKDIREVIATLPIPKDGKPIDLVAVWRNAGLGKAASLKPCTQGIGTRGGTSRGVGSGSRLRLYECECVPAVKIRAGRDNLDCTCNDCSALFRLV